MGIQSKYKKPVKSSKLGHVFSTNDADAYAEKFTDSIMSGAKDYILNKSVTIRPLEPHWINSQIKRESRKMKRSFSKAKRNNTAIC